MITANRLDWFFLFARWFHDFIFLVKWWNGEMMKWWNENLCGGEARGAPARSSHASHLGEMFFLYLYRFLFFFLFFFFFFIIIIFFFVWFFSCWCCWCCCWHFVKLDLYNAGILLLVSFFLFCSSFVLLFLILIVLWGFRNRTEPSWVIANSSRLVDCQWIVSY